MALHDLQNPDSTLFTRRNLRCFLLIFLCFFLTSSGYLSWLYHLMTFISPKAADLLTMGGGYAMQAAGLALAAWFLFRRRNAIAPRQLFLLFIVIYTVCLIPALLSRSGAGTIIFGLIMNFFCGLIAAFYLHVLTFDTDGEFRSVLFGFSYAAATVAGWLLSLPTDRHFLQSPHVLIVYLVLAAALVILILIRIPLSEDVPEDSGEEYRFPGNAPAASALHKSPVSSAIQGLPLLAGATILVFSLVKNIGFGFPTADLYTGISLEASRVFYAIGLCIAGCIMEKNRKYGAVCTMAALVTPFLILSLSGEPVSQTIFWALDYFVYAFFSVYRILLFSDLAKTRRIMYYAGLGLFFGRLGDSVGSSLSTILAGRVTILVILAALLFIAAIFLFFRLYQSLYMPVPDQPPSEQELFDRFSARYGLSSREQEVLQLLLDKKTSPEIADALFISDRTVKFHIHNLLSKTGCRNRTDLLKQYRNEQPCPPQTGKKGVS